MTRTNIVVSVAANHMTLDVMQPAPGQSLRGTWQNWLAYLNGQDADDTRIVESITVRGSTKQQGLATVFQPGLAALKQSRLGALPDSAVQVVLGPSLSHVGLLDLLTDANVKLSDVDRRAYIDVWVSQNWGLQPSDYDVRCIPMGTGGRYLVTAIARSVVETIDTLCKQEKLHLRSCMPALAIQLVELLKREVPQPSANDTPAPQALDVSALLERGLDGERAGTVQFVVCNAAGPLSITRMWLPTDGQVADAVAIPQVVARLCAQHRSVQVPRITMVDWPHTHTKGTPA